ncbi:SUMO deconjugating cysteine peptidase Ulp2 [Rhodotorula toruloides]|uniref:SUMO deconjugating cysteine peptidase Ulp2 n=1 Tax=Rhodotorula toruloides TaxID=5286 RepID=A0A511KLP9_RHOTO|nr:SUMO deconjugating cysteine peptidase Ulp2 [Rhodotorula toruloides]
MPRKGFSERKQRDTHNTLDLTVSPPLDRRQPLPLDGPPAFATFSQEYNHSGSSHRQSHPIPTPRHSFATGANAVTSHYFSPPAHEQPHHPHASGSVAHLAHTFRNQPLTPQNYPSSRSPLPKQSPPLAPPYQSPLPLQPAPPHPYPPQQQLPHLHQHPRAGNDYQYIGQQYAPHSQQQRSSTTPGLRSAAAGPVSSLFIRNEPKVFLKASGQQIPTPYTSAIAGGRAHQQTSYGRTASTASPSTVPSQQRPSSSVSRLPQNYRISHSPPRNSPPSASIPFGLPAPSASRAESSSKSHVINILSDDESTPAPPALDHDAFSLAEELFPSDAIIDEDEMSRRGVPFQPQDPEAGVRSVFGGWQSGGSAFYADDKAQASSSAAKGKAPRRSFNFGRAPGFDAAVKDSVSPSNKGGGRRTQKEAINSLPGINKTARPDSHSLGTIPATSFHRPEPAASTSTAAHQKPFKSPILHQNAPLTQQEREGRKRQAQVARSLNGAGKGKGKGKGKASADVVELSSDEDGDDRVVLVGQPHQDEDETDPIIDDDQRRLANGRQGGHRRYSDSHATASRTPTKGRGRKSFPHDRFVDESQQPSSPDPIGMTGLATDRALLGKLHDGRAFADQAVHGRVKTIVAGIEEKTRDVQGGSLVQQMKGKQPQRRQHDPDGGPTDDGEISMPKSAKKLPRASQQVQSDVCAVKVEPYMLGRRAFAAEHIVSQYSLIFNSRGHPRGWKLAIHRHPPQQEPEEVCSDIKAEHLQTMEWSSTEKDGSRPFVFFQFNSGKGKKIVSELTADCEDPGQDATVLFILENAPRFGWQDDSMSGPPTQEDIFFRGLGEWGRQVNIPFTQCGFGKTTMLCDLYRRVRSETANLLGKIKRGGPKGKKPPGKGGFDPRQSRLSFSTGASTSPTTRRLVQDEDGDYVEAMKRSLDDQGPRVDDDDLEFMTSQAPATRRSTRPSTSNLASSSRNEATAVNTIQPPKSPSPQPMSEEDRKWEEWWKAEDKAYKAEQIVVEYPINQPGSVSLPWADIKRLKPNEFLNDTLIEFGLKHVMHDVLKADERRPDDEKLAPKIHLFNSFFYSQLSTRKDKKNDPYALVEKWTKKVDIFDKRFIVVPINEHFHWYLAIIYNPAAILREYDKPPPPELRQSGRKRASLAGSESVSASPSVSRAESPAQTSHHFDKKAEGAADVEMQDAEVANGDADAQVQDEIEEQEQEQRHRRGIEQEMVGRKQSLQADEAPEEQAEPAQRDAIGVEPPSRESDATEMQVDGSPELGEAPVQAEAMAVDIEETDKEVTGPRPDVEGGGRKASTSAQDDRDRSNSPKFQRLRRGTREGSVIVQDDAEPTSAQSRQAADDDDDLPAPQDLGKAKTAVPAKSITIDDDESAPNQSQEVGPSSAVMRKKRSGSSSTDRKAVPTASAYAETKTAGSSSKKRKSQQFGPADPEPHRAEELKRKTQEEETQKVLDLSERVSSLVDKDGVDLNKCYILTFDSLGDAHAPVARRLKEYLIREAETKKGMDKDKLSDHLVETVRVEVPQQPNYCDCGLYLLHFVEVLFRDADRKVRQILAVHQTNNGKRPRNDLALRQYRNELWEFEAAQKKRTTMLEQVKALMEEWARNVLPLREQAEREKEERRRKRKLEKEEKEAKEAAQRAEQDDAQVAAASQNPTAAMQGQDQSAGKVDAPPSAQVPATDPSRPQSSPPTPSAPAANTRSGKSKAKVKSKKADAAEVLELSDDATCSTSGSPVKQSGQYFPSLTPVNGDQPVHRAEAGTPPGLRPSRRANATNGDATVAAEASTSMAEPTSLAAAPPEEDTSDRPTLVGSAPSSTVAGQKRPFDNRAPVSDPEKPFDLITATSASISSAPPARPASAPTSQVLGNAAHAALAALRGQSSTNQTDSPATPPSASASQVQPMQVDEPPALPAPDLAVLADHDDTLGDLPETQPSEEGSPPRKKVKRSAAPVELDSRRMKESSGESQEEATEGSQELFAPPEERTEAGELPPSNQQQAASSTTEEQPQSVEAKDAGALPSKNKGRGGGKKNAKGGRAGRAAEKKTDIVTLSDSEDDGGEK